VSLTGRSRCTSCLAYVSTALFLELDHLCHNCYQGDEDYPLASTETADLAHECLLAERHERLDTLVEQITPENRHEAEWGRTEETSPSDIDPVAI
jgi:hypothetical protein